jgi:hypothetical protein
MTSLKDFVALQPDPARHQKSTKKLYALYRELHDAFGGVEQPKRRPVRRDEGPHRIKQ